jgi:predicted RNA-binding protein Jag
MAAGYPERYAMKALGHSSKAIHRAYSKKAQVRLPSLEEYERKIVSLTITDAQEITTSIPMKEEL